VAAHYHKTNKAKTNLPLSPSAQNQRKNGLSLLHQRNNQLTFPETCGTDTYDRWCRKYSRNNQLTIEGVPNFQCICVGTIAKIS